MIRKQFSYIEVLAITRKRKKKSKVPHYDLFFLLFPFLSLSSTP